MLRQFTAGLLAAAAFLAPLSAIAQENGSADDLGVMSISLKDMVKQGLLISSITPLRLQRSVST
jgi:hypothetical protein